MRLPPEHWRCIRTIDSTEWLNREIRRRMCMVGTFSDGGSASMLVTARLKHVTKREWNSRRKLDVAPLDEWPYRRADS